jgi:AbrB family looped-hinge helix DNA binding protein
MPLVTVKTKYQVTIPQDVRKAVGVEKGDLLEANVENGKIILTPKTTVDREGAFADLHKIAKQARERWEVEGKSEDDIERLIEEEVEAVRSELHRQGAQSR